MTTTLASLGIDPNNSPYRSADLLLAGKLTALYQYAKSLEERLNGLAAQTTITPVGGFDPSTFEGNVTYHTIHFDPLNLSQQNLP